MQDSSDNQQVASNNNASNDESKQEGNNLTNLRSLQAALDVVQPKYKGAFMYGVVVFGELHAFARKCDKTVPDTLQHFNAVARLREFSKMDDISDLQHFFAEVRYL